MAETTATLSQLETIRRRVDELAKANPMSLSVRRQQDEIASFMLLNAADLLDAALVVARAIQCDRCRGNGSWWVITDCDSGYDKRCPKCGGTGKAVAAAVGAV